MKKHILRLILLGAVLWLQGCDGKTEERQKGNETAGIVMDEAYVLLEEPKLMKDLADYNRWMQERFDIDMRVITTMDRGDVNLFANKRFNDLQAHSRSHSGKAMLLVLNTTQDKVRLEVSEALEPVFTDAFVSYLQRQGVVPYLREGKIADGIFMAMELIRDRLGEAEAGKEFMPPMQSRSIGAGAKTDALIGKKDPNAKHGDNVTASSDSDPKSVLQYYISDVLKKHNTNPDLDIYTDATKDFFRHWTVTTVNQDHEVHNLAPCTERMQTLYSAGGVHAVLAVLPYDKNRKCAPYFFKKEQGKWKLDIATMAQILRFNADMMFHFDIQKRLEGEAMYYAYAFDGYTLDRNGYPYTSKKRKPDDARWGYQTKGYYHPGDKKENVRAWISYVWQGSPADIRLGLEPMDKIYAVGEGASRIENVTHQQLMEYMHNIPSDEVATVVVEHYYLNGKETNNFDAVLKPNISFKYETKRGIAP